MGTNTLLVSYPGSFRLEESKNLVESADCKIVKVFTPKFLNHSQYGMSAGKAEEIRDFVRGAEGIELLIIDEHPTALSLNHTSRPDR